MQPSCYLFDMDHTLIDNDCDVSWKKFLIRQGLAPDNAMELAEQYYRQYLADQLDLHDFLQFQLAEFRGRTPDAMAELARLHYQQFVANRFYLDLQRLVRQALASGRPTAIITSTNAVIARPVAEALKIPCLMATELELVDGLFTGAISGTYCGGQGKILIAREFCQHRQLKLADATYYGDSPADIPLLSTVGLPVAVNPGPELANLAQQKNWSIITPVTAGAILPNA